MFQVLICDRKRKEKHFLLKLGAQRDFVFKTIKHKSIYQAQKRMFRKVSFSLN